MNRIQGLYTSDHEGIIIHHDRDHTGIFSIRLYEEEENDFSISSTIDKTTLKTRELIFDVDKIRFKVKRPLSFVNNNLLVDSTGKLIFRPSKDVYYLIGFVSFMVYYWIRG